MLCTACVGTIESVLRRAEAEFRFPQAYTYQQPFRLLLFGSGAPGLRGRGIAPQMKCINDQPQSRATTRLKQIKRVKVAPRRFHPTAERNALKETVEASSQGTQDAIGSLFASRTVLTPSGDETIVDQAPTPSRQGHRGVGGRCAQQRLQNPAATAAMGFGILQVQLQE